MDAPNQTLRPNQKAEALDLLTIGCASSIAIFSETFILVVMVWIQIYGFFIDGICRILGKWSELDEVSAHSFGS